MKTFLQLDTTEQADAILPYVRSEESWASIMQENQTTKLPCPNCLNCKLTGFYLPCEKGAKT